MYYFLGIQRIDFTNRETGEKIKGWNIWFSEPSDGRGVGVVPFKKFYNDNAMTSLGGVDQFNGREFQEVSIEFGRTGRVMDFDFIG